MKKTLISTRSLVFFMDWVSDEKQKKASEKLHLVRFSCVHWRCGFFNLTCIDSTRTRRQYQAFGCSTQLINISFSSHSLLSYFQIYFTYLYWVSIAWIVFCIVDIVRHKRKLHTHLAGISKLDSNRMPMNIFSKHHDEKLASMPQFNLELINHSDNDESHSNKSILDADSQSSDGLSSLMARPRNVLMRRQVLDPTGTHTLRNYVSHRKDTIVQRIIGYNYDDHSTAGGLYIRVGTGSKKSVIKCVRMKSFSFCI